MMRCSRAWGDLHCKVHQLLFQPDINNETAKYTEPNLRGEVYLAVSDLTLGKSHVSCLLFTMGLNVGIQIASCKGETIIVNISKCWKVVIGTIFGVNFVIYALSII